MNLADIRWIALLWSSSITVGKVIIWLALKSADPFTGYLIPYRFERVKKPGCSGWTVLVSWFLVFLIYRTKTLATSFFPVPILFPRVKIGFLFFSGGEFCCQI